MDACDQHLISAIPDPQNVEKRLVAARREVHLLKQLLKLSESAAKERKGRPMMARASAK